MPILGMVHPIIHNTLVQAALKSLIFADNLFLTGITPPFLSLE